MDIHEIIAFLGSQQTNKAVDTLSKLGLFAVVVTALGVLWKWFKRPKLKIGPMKADIWTYVERTHPDRMVITTEISNNGKIRAEGCVATIRISGDIINPNTKYALHWAGMPYSLTTTGEQPVDIGRADQRLDIIFTQENQPIPGCWLGTSWPLSFELPGRDQFYLPGGYYYFELEVGCVNGTGQKKRFIFESPRSWQELRDNLPKKIKWWQRWRSLVRDLR
jgi:hypothetical protein